MVSENQIEEILKSLFQKVQFAQEPAGLYDPLRYSMNEGSGKRVRPRLCLLTYSLFKENFDDSILMPAAALEVFHNFTLVHDDIMDNADLRHGTPTVVKKWDANTAILSGDVMSIESFRLIAKAPSAVLPAVMKLFTDTATQVCEGQQYDMDFEKVPTVLMRDYMKMIGLKTAVLIACSAKIGALIAGANKRACDLLYKFGYDLGLAFQITDDYLDTFGDERVFGKTIGGDIVNNKKSWLLTRALEKIGEMEKSGVLPDICGEKALHLAMEMPIETDAQKAAKVAKFKQIYEEIGVDEDAKYEIIRLHAQAMSYAGLIGLGKVRFEVLRRYADRLVGRTK